MTGEKILVVDDGQDNRDFLVRYVLEPNNFVPLTARDGQEGLAMALKHEPDLILLDLQMPRMDGMTVLRKLAPYNKGIPVILMTIHGSEDIAIEAYRLGAKDYVRKPYTVEEMLDAIERALAETRLRKEKEALTARILQANRELKQRVDEMNVLYSIGKSVTALMSMSELLPRVVNAAAQITGAQQAALYLRDEQGLVCRAVKLPNQETAKAINERVDDKILVRVLKRGEPVSLAPEQLARLQPKQVLFAAAYAPLVLKEESICILSVSNGTKGSNTFTSHHAALLSALSDYAAIAIENARNYEALRQKSEEEKAEIREQFERFVPPAVVEQAINTPEQVQLGGERCEISVLFADIRGYTSWSEDAPPEHVIETLNHYLSLAAEVVLSWGGTLDKFMGDGLMAIFNAPTPQPDHVHRAADAALALMRAAEEVSALYGHRLTYSVGVHVGEAVVGYIGTERALNYTAIGDTVNLAKRLQEYAAPGQILISEEVAQRLGHQLKARALGQLNVKGRKKPTFAFELHDLENGNE